MIAKRVTAPNQLHLGLNLSTKKTRKREFFEEMNRVVPWSALVALIESHAPRARTGPPALCHRDDDARSLPSTMVQPVGSGNGRSAARWPAVPGVRGP